MFQQNLKFIFLQNQIRILKLKVEFDYDNLKVNLSIYFSVMQNSEQPVYCFTMIGATKVGKTSIASRMISDKFSLEYSPTVLDTYRTSKILDNQEFQLQLVDTRGCDDPSSETLTASFIELQPNFKHGFIIVFAIDSAESYKVSLQMLQQIKSDPLKSKIPCILVGNKSDNEARRQVSHKDTEKVADFVGIKVLETSALAGRGIEEIFRCLIEEIQLQGVIMDSSREKEGSSQPRSPGLCEKEICLTF